ncbi:MAG: endonuclease III [Bacteroides sp.]|nr:endonuclease III [Prevotella sp.]MCM1408657.1 endonuclease III [Treponema brennaborense]MCM1470518.1 endonuclease III [Bacteroides sp.]
MRFLTDAEIRTVFDRFRNRNPEPKTELIAPNPFTMLVSVMLSAQATDKSVNKAAAALYAAADTPEKMMALGESGLIPYIKSIGLYRVKAQHIIAMSKMLAEQFHSKVPDTMEDLQRLPGVGRKTANVILNVVYGKPVMPVDTHLLRISPRMGLSGGSTPAAVEQDLLARIPSEYLLHAHHWLILHGRYVCTARAPACDACLIADICPKNNVVRK